MELGDKKGELSNPVTTAKTNGKTKTLLSWPGFSQWKAWTLCLLQSSQLPFPLYNILLLPLPCEDLQVACHGCRPQNCNSLLLLNKPIFAGIIPGTLFVLGQQMQREKFSFCWHIYWNNLSGWFENCKRLCNNSFHLKGTNAWSVLQVTNSLWLI